MLGDELGEACGNHPVALAEALADDYVITGIACYNNIDELGRPVRVGEGWMSMMLPPMRLRDFTFTSLSDAV